MDLFHQLQYATSEDIASTSTLINIVWCAAPLELICESSIFNWGPTILFDDAIHDIKSRKDCEAAAIAICVQKDTFSKFTIRNSNNNTIFLNSTKIQKANREIGRRQPDVDTSTEAFKNLRAACKRFNLDPEKIQLSNFLTIEFKKRNQEFKKDEKTASGNNRLFKFTVNHSSAKNNTETKRIPLPRVHNDDKNMISTSWQNILAEKLYVDRKKLSLKVDDVGVLAKLQKREMENKIIFHHSKTQTAAIQAALSLSLDLNAILLEYMRFFQAEISQKSLM